MATMAFNKFFCKNIDDYSNTEEVLSILYSDDEVNKEETYRYLSVLQKALNKGAMFDARVFNILKEEVTNCILWRQNDASRNSIQMVGFSIFSQKEMQNRSCSEVQDMLMLQKGINWNDFPTKYKRGSCCVRVPVKGSECSKWTIDNEIPIFKGEGRDYIERLIYPTPINTNK